MTSHGCPRCGLETQRSHGAWPHRHPAAAVTLAVIVLAMVVAHPWLVGCLAVGGVLYAVDGERRRRQALATRADWEHRALIAAPLTWPSPPREVPRPPGPPRQRPADHRSPTEPIRTARN